MFKQNVLEQLKQFVQTVTDYRGNHKNLTNIGLIKIALNLLEDLPAAREIVFEYFTLLAEIAVQSYVASANIDPQTGLPPQQGRRNVSQHQQTTEDESFLIVQEALENCICKGPAAWGPIIASWSLDLVGSLSDKYTQRKMSIGAACNYWLNCGAMRGLLTLISMCFRKLSNAEAESCVETLLTAFQRYPLTYDWVVARLGGCFPLKIISQIFQCGIKRFVDDFRCRFESEIGILEYLSFAHEQEQKVALREMMLEGFYPKKPLDTAIIPFLLVITNYSDTVLQNLVSVFLDIYNDALCEVIIQKAPLWMSNKLFAEMQPSLNNLVLRLKLHGAKLLIAVANMAEQHIWCQDFLEYSLLELEQLILSARTCPLISDLSSEETKYLLWSSCLSTNLIEQQTAVRLLLIVSTQNSHIYYQTISEMLRKNYEKNSNGIGAIVRIFGGQTGVVEFPDIMPGLKMVLEDISLQEQFQRARLSLSAGTDSEAYNTFHNLNTLTKMQKKSYFPYIKSQLLMHALNECLPKILQILEITLNKLVLSMDRKGNERGVENYKAYHCNNNNNEEYSPDRYEKIGGKKMKIVIDDEAQQLTPMVSEEADRDEKRLRLSHVIVDLLNTIEAASKGSVLRTSEILKLASLTVKYFFIGLTEKNSTRRAIASNRAFSLLHRQCSARKTARMACLRELVEGALFYHGYLFGQYEEQDMDDLKIPSLEMVLVQNQAHSAGSNANRTVLHSGVIGRGLRPELIQSSVGCDPEKQNFFLKALNSCCTDSDKQNIVDGYTLISLMLVELVSTDVMYNGLPFPDEDFSKVTMERDLLIRRAFITSPILWAIMGFIAAHRPALCFSSVLLRALCATCLHQWRAKNVNRYEMVNTNDELFQCTQKLLQLLSMGQLLPPPLSHLHIIIEYFEAPEIALILKECIWNYLKDHVPSPALFNVDNNGVHVRSPNLCKIPPQYVETLRHLMQKKLPILGQHYHQMFVMSELHGFTSSENVIVAPSVIMDLDD